MSQSLSVLEAEYFVVAMNLDHGAEASEIAEDWA